MAREKCQQWRRTWLSMCTCLIFIICLFFLVPFGVCSIMCVWGGLCRHLLLSCLYSVLGAGIAFYAYLCNASWSSTLFPQRFLKYLLWIINFWICQFLTNIFTLWLTISRFETHFSCGMANQENIFFNLDISFLGNLSSNFSFQYFSSIHCIAKHACHALT